MTFKALSEPRGWALWSSQKRLHGQTGGRRLRGRRKNLACFTNSFHYVFSMTTTVTSKNMITIPMGIARKFGVKPGFSFDWFDTGRPDEIAIRVIPDRKELSRRLKGAGKSYSPLRDSVHELLQERSEEMA